MAPLSNDDLPVKVLRYNTRKILSDLLNGIKIFKSDENLCRDWRGFAFLCGITVSSHRQDRDPTEDILLKWQQKEDATIKQLLQFLEKLDRFDIIADTEVMICEDVEIYLREPVLQLSMQLALNSSAEQQLITIDDIDRKSRGLEPQIYDAIILYADNDREVALQLLQELENDNFKLCFKDRDIIPGVNFEHEAFMTLIQERCNKVIVILSPDFLQCPFNGFLHLFAQAVSIDERKRKVIPCIYKFQSREQMPTEFKFYTMLRYDDINRWPEIFWNRLKTSIAAAKIDYPTNSGVRIQELPSNRKTKEMKSIMPGSEASSKTNTIEIKMNDIVLPEMKCKEKRAVTSHKETFCKVNDDILCKSLEQHDTCDCDNILNEKVENKPQKYSSFKKFLKTITRSKSKESRKKCLLAS